MFHSPNPETALASELLEITHEAEIDRLLPFLVKPAVSGLATAQPLVAKVASQILKKVVAKAIPHIRATPSRRPAHAAHVPHASSHIGSGDDFGFGSAVSTRDARRWGTDFQRSRPSAIQLAMSHRFVQAARRASQQAALAVTRQIRRGRPVTVEALRRVVFRALVGAVRERAPFLLPTMRAVSIALKRKPGYTGSSLPAVRPGRITSGLGRSTMRQRPGYTGAALPPVRGAILGPPRSGAPCHTCAKARARRAAASMRA
jgi:hypothetical protein